MSLTIETLRAEHVAGEIARLGRSAERDSETENIVRDVLANVRLRGYDAVREYSERFDRVGVSQAQLCVPEHELERALNELTRTSPALVRSLETMIAHIRAFATAERSALLDVELPLPHGGTVGQRWLPIARIGVYVPGGRAFYPSTLAMTVIPAQIAGVQRIVAVTPPRAEGPDLRVLATARLVGLKELLTVGGAQAIAHLAFGEPNVDLIAGPGNRFVAEAKRQLLGHCGIDSVAGPTEVLVLADASAEPAAVAEDLLAQAEHDPDAAAVCIADDAQWLTHLQREVQERAERSARREIVQASLARHGRLYLADFETAVAFGQAWAPEHLQIVAASPERYVARLTTAGALFIGHASAEAFGDYGAGPNHVLPTGRTARFCSPLGVASYMKRQSLLNLSAEDARVMAPWVADVADAEGLVHHAQSARMRV
jgi:histidinol dehydrogenase